MIMRKLINILLLTVLQVCCAGVSQAQDIFANGLYYNIINETQVAVAPAYFDGVNHYEGCIILPEQVYCDGVNYEVAAIAPRAFWQSAVTEVQIPNSITMIGEAAFADAEDLTSITLPLKLKYVSRYMLAGTAVTNLILPEGVTDIGTGAFEDCSRLHTIFLPATLQRIGSNNIHVMLPDAATTQRYQDDGIWGDDELFSLWIDEGLAVLPTMQQENMGGNWTALNLGNHLAYKVYGPDGYLSAITAADRYFLPIGAQSDEYLVVPTTLMYDEEDLELVATNQPDAIEEIEQEPQQDFKIVGLDGTIYIEGDTHGLWTFIYDVYGNLWYERPAVNNTISLPNHRVYIVKVGDTIRKVLLY